MKPELQYYKSSSIFQILQCLCYLL